jgi:hypothetical protein
LSKYTIASVTKTFVITLAPPLLPLEAIAMRILKQLLPSGVPCSGSCSRLSNKSANSILSEGYF